MRAAENNEEIISIHYDERENDYFAVVEDGSGESWVIEAATNLVQAGKITQKQYPLADVRLA